MTEQEIQRKIFEAGQRIDMFDKVGALAKLDEVKDDIENHVNEVQSHFYFLYGWVQEMYGNYPLMRDCCRKAIDLTNEIDNKCRANSMLSVSFLSEYEHTGKQDMSLIEAGLVEIDKTIALAEQSPNKDYVIIEALRYKANILCGKHDYANAAEVLNCAAEIAERTHQNQELAIITCQNAKILADNGQKQLALAELFRAETAAREGCKYDFYCRVAIHRLAMMFELESEDPSLGEKAKADLIEMSKQKI